MGRVHKEEDRCIEADRLGRSRLTAIQAVESGSSETEKRWAKLNHIKRGVASLA